MGFAAGASVRMVYLSGGVTEAIKEINKVKKADKTLTHLVLGGHGSPLSLGWHPGTLEPRQAETNSLLAKIKEMKVATVMMDSCLNGGKTSSFQYNLCKWVAYKTLTTRASSGVGSVFCSSLSLTKRMVDISSFAPYQLTIMKNGKIVGTQY